MRAEEQKVVQYLTEAHATERALVRVLQSQIAMTPRGSYRSLLERHLEETRRHGDRLAERLEEIGDGGAGPINVAIGLVETIVGQALALGKTPWDLIRGHSGEEKVLKNARDTCATEAQEIATYMSIQRLGEKVGDERTAELARSILADEERMLERVRGELPKLTDAVVAAEIEGKPTYELAETGAGEAVRAAGRQARETTRKTAESAAGAARRTARQARRVPGVAQAEGEIRGAVATEEDLAIANYGSLTADEITSRLPELSQIELGKIDAYERRHQNRRTVLSRVTSLRGDEPWPGYDEQTVADVQARLAEGDGPRAAQVRDYERTHKKRASVLKAAEREAAV
ncbi:MAG TPA: DUF892 family protein [Baekduia sp.]|nr:DUF892 family protein [Baekduia sp.]